MPPRQLTILITGCSPGGTGAALATAMHNAGHRVFATTRNPSKLSELSGHGIETVAMDITSTSSITSALSAVSSSLPKGKGLDMLINNAATNYTMPIADAPLDTAREVFETNVWGQLAVTQAFLPLLLKSATATFQPLIVNHTSVGSVAALPFQGVYNSSKAAFAMLSDTMRLELAAFGIRVVELKTAGVRTNLISNSKFNTESDRLPKGSIYNPAREIVEKAMSQEELRVIGISADEWAAQVSAPLLSQNPPRVIWRGESALVSRIASMLPSWIFEGMLKKMTKLNLVEDIIQESRR
ncbi:putative short-chain dehydrogenase [Colletotrichum karsti]|uniref:Short-chain dehydrogenase n=1 Tax=Colletotrichum karsti TaxID=1095194 RepID=A0A9P6I742_9PEZI|nr:putative short-chain dehydrogenase [Colletotrichum karsti]KAF9877459.1 putative short-chain dehydrogenase [Colletotrichum karsti]